MIITFHPQSRIAIEATSMWSILGAYRPIKLVQVDKNIANIPKIDSISSEEQKFSDFKIATTTSSENQR